MRADLIAQRSLAVESVDDENNWWHAVKAMSDEDLDLLPFGFLKKYGSFVKKM